MDAGTIIIAVLGSSVISAIVSALLNRKQRKAEETRTVAEAHKTDSDSASQITEAALKLVDPLNKRIEDLEAKAIEQEKKIEKTNQLLERYAHRVIYLMRGIEQLLQQMSDQKIQPCWKPDQWNPE